MKRYSWLAIVSAVGLLVASTTYADELTGVFGAWDLTLQSRGGARPSWVKLYQENDTTVAEFVGTSGGKSRAADVKLDGNSCSWTVGDATYHATLTDGKLTGELVRGERRTPFTGERAIRRIDLNGTWDIELEVGDRRMQRVVTFEQHGDQWEGRYSGGSLTERPVRDLALDHGRLTFTIDVGTDDREFTVDYDVQVQGEYFNGSVAVRGADWRGSVKATRRRTWSDPIQLLGNDLSNWDFQRVGGENHWKVVDGVLINESGGWNLVTKDKFKDYKLRIDVKVPPHGNSGIYLNGRYEVQVADTYGEDVSEGGMGAIYGRAVPASNPSKPADEWQTFEITFVNYWATIVLNGTTIVDNVLIEGITGGALDSQEAEPGPIMLQGDHGPIQYRNIVLTPLAN